MAEQCYVDCEGDLTRSHRNENSHLSLRLGRLARGYIIASLSHTRTSAVIITSSLPNYSSFLHKLVVILQITLGQYFGDSKSRFFFVLHMV